MVFLVRKGSLGLTFPVLIILPFCPCLYEWHIEPRAGTSGKLR
jgi:hypothetical protein